jgi:hypothetical protein
MSNENKTTLPVVTGTNVAAPMSADDEIKQLQLANLRLEKEAKELELQERQYHIKDLRGRLADRDLSEKQEKQNREAQGRTFAQDEATDAYRWSVCTHRKGGIVSARDMRALTTGGSEDQYAVIKHQMINGDIWVRCNRCGRTWSPPVESNFYFKGGKSVAPVDGVFDKDKFRAAQEDYQRAVQFPTRNTMSGSVQCRFQKFNLETGRLEDASVLYRESVKDTNLR